MRLKSLELKGFKSFAETTSFEFHSGVTAIVGPNGCGKSNVVDAIRWVLGESSAKALRGGEMADVIFNGTDKRKPVGMAEVTLTFTDCEKALKIDYNEVGISRRVFRDGKGEYLLNGAKCRRKDITDLFMDTGIGRSAYSIMEQGKIDQLISSKPEDRRAVFEEAAGITKFKTQKKEALRKLDYTEANLLRVADIVAEVKRQMNSLQRQAGKAKRYQLLLDNVRVLDTHYSFKKYKELRAEKSELETSIQSLRREQDELESHVGEKETSIITSRDALQSLETELSEIRQKIVDTNNRIQGARNRIEFNTERSTELVALIEQNQQEIEATSEKLSHQEIKLKDTEDALTNLEKNIQTQESQLEEQNSLVKTIRQERAELLDRQAVLRNEVTEAQNTIISSKARLEHTLQQLEAGRNRREQLQEELSRLKREEEEKSREESKIKEEVETLAATIAEQEAVLLESEKRFQSLRDELESAEEELRETRAMLAQKESRLQVLRQLMADGEGFEKGTQSVLRGLNEPETYRGSVRGVLASHVDADQEFIPAIEAALGSHLQSVLISDHQMAEQIIDVLTRDKLGQATLMPQDLSPDSAELQLMTLPDGAICWAADRVTVDSSVKPLVDRLLENVLIVESIQKALELRREIPAATFVTRTGELVSPEGMIRGGASGEAGGSVLQRQSEIKSLEEETALLNTLVDDNETRHQRIQNELKTLETSLDEQRSKVQASIVSRSTLEGGLSLITREIQQLQTKTEGQQWELAELEKRQQAADTIVAELRETQQNSEKNIEESNAQLSEIEQAVELTARKEDEAMARLNELYTSLAVEKRAGENLREQQQPMAARVHELTEVIERRETEVQSYRDRVESAANESKDLEVQIETTAAEGREYQNELDALGGQREARNEAVREAERLLAETRRRLSKLAEQRGSEEIKITKLDLRLENVSATISQRYGLELETFRADNYALMLAIEEQKKSRNRSNKRRATLALKQAEEAESAALAAAEAGKDGDSAAAGLEETGESSAESGAEDSPDAGVESESSNEKLDAESWAEGGEEEGEDAMPLPAGEEGELVAVEEESPDWEFVEEVLEELKQRLDSMGPVNLDAIEEFDELEERYNFLDNQYQDLVSSKAELHGVINRINKTTKQMFAETFEEVTNNFKSMFKELFGQGAQANLTLLDDGDPLESGIEIIAKPPGKKLQSISLLSGGERSMTAVALLFAIYMVKPSPFCVLDELDAPLDEANIGRFLRVLDRFIDQSQFVVITHSKRTMNRADIMYGVTMEEFGVSKPIGVKLTTAEKAAAAKADKAMANADPEHPVDVEEDEEALEPEMQS